ncbi:uncharacterized protein [Diabrotica undecimpunctata]|uniref:uncharacterized protein n=1 Tax=Diabrotica undecimpunctata TaxID=50387 RepID=UPI003B63A68C
MKQILVLSILVISTFGAKLNQYLPPRPENDNAQYQPPALPNQPFSAASQSQQQFATPNFQQASRQYLTPNKGSGQPGQGSSPFGQVAGQFGQQSNQFGLRNSFNANGNGNSDKQYVAPNKQDASGQSSNSFGNFQQPNSFNGNVNGGHNRQYLAPNKQDASGQSSNSFGEVQTRNNFNGNGQRPISSFGSKSTNQAPNSGNDNTFAPSFNSFNQKAAPNGQFGQSGSFLNGFNQQSGQGQYNGQFSGSQSAPIGLIRSEFNPDQGDGHYSYSYETENGISAQEEGFVQNEGKSAQGAFSYTSPEGEQISLEYTADANGFVPKGSHVPEIPEAILKSIEQNKAEEARGEYNEGSYREEYNQEGSNGNNRYQGNLNNKYQGNVNGGYQGNGPREQSPFASQENRQVASLSGPKSFGAQSNGYQYSSPSKPNNAADQGTFASQQNNQVTPFGGQQGSKSSFGQNSNNGYQYSASNIAKSNFADQGSFASQQNQQVAQFGKQQGLFGKATGPKTSFGSSAQFGQQNGDSKNIGKQNNGYQYPIPEPSPFSSQQNKQTTSFGSQFSLKSQYRAPEQSPSASQNNGQFSSFQGPKSQVSGFSGNNGFNSQSAFQNKGQQSGASGQFGTVQDSNGGYKY